MAARRISPAASRLVARYRWICAIDPTWETPGSCYLGHSLGDGVGKINLGFSKAEGTHRRTEHFAGELSRRVFDFQTRIPG